MRRRVLLLVLGIALTGCAASPKDAEPDVALHLQQRLDTAFTAGARATARPAVGPVRFALPDGWGSFMSRCMNDAGFDEFQLDRDSGFTNGGVASTRTGAEGLAWYQCGQGYPQYFTQYVKFTPAELETLYEYYKEFLVPCLGALGAPVTEVPSRAAFTDGGEGQPGWWNPFLAVSPPASTADVDLLFAKCPAYPTESP